MRWITTICLALWPGGLAALDLALPEGAHLVAERDKKGGMYELPIAPFSGAEVPNTRLRGDIRFEVWRVDAGFTTTQALTDAVRVQLIEAGFKVQLDCETSTCGGFDFRFGTEVLPPPDMFVDLADFWALSAFRQTDTGEEGVSFLISRTAQAGLIHIVHAAQAGSEASEITLVVPVSKAATPDIGTDRTNQDTIAGSLETQGRVVLTGLVFETGSSTLNAAKSDVLRELADYLQTNPEARITLVGHTDSEGALDKNITLSERRAVAVMDHLVGTLGVDAQQLDARGVGYLAPLAGNGSPAGRDMNRRVEAVLTSAD